MIMTTSVESLLDYLRRWPKRYILHYGPPLSMRYIMGTGEPMAKAWPVSKEPIPGEAVAKLEREGVLQCVESWQDSETGIEVRILTLLGARRSE